MILKIVLMALVLVAAAQAAFAQDYPSGIVTHVVDGDSFNVEGFGQVSLAQVNSPEMGTIAGVHAREYSMEQLLNAVVFLDKDDLDGTYADGGIPCLVYLSGSDGKPNLNRNFNKMIVDAGYAAIKKSTPSEFDPALW
jgi:endonuclease YncB( thermonuclease family)